MASQKIVTINGRKYDAATGLPIGSEPAKPAKQTKSVPKATGRSAAATPSTAVHATVQRSQTLHRRAAKKPAAASRRPGTGRHMDIARSAKVTKFAPHPVVKPVEKKTDTPDKPAQIHPVVQRAQVTAARRKKTPAQAPATAKEVKDAAISAALAAPKAPPEKPPKRPRKLWRRRALVTVIILAAITASAYAVYRFVPSISVGIAATQANVNASYPEYTPDGYSLSHPVTYEDGKVTLKFTSNSNENSYTIVQARSSWDSSAVLDSVVKPAAGDNYVTTKERGLTIYTFNTSAAWVNKGILYTIQSKASLSGEQVRRIATSL